MSIAALKESFVCPILGHRWILKVPGQERRNTIIDWTEIIAVGAITRAAGSRKPFEVHKQERTLRLQCGR